MDLDSLIPNMYVIKAIIILDNDGNRIVSKYYGDAFPSIKEQKTFEKNLFKKTHRVNGDIVMFEGLTCVYRSTVDVFFYVVGSSAENELLLMNILNCVYESVNLILRRNIEKKNIFDKMDSVFLAIDEICDSGMLLEADPETVASRAQVRNDADIPLGDQTITQVLDMAKEQIGWSLFR